MQTTSLEANAAATDSGGYKRIMMDLDGRLAGIAYCGTHHIDTRTQIHRLHYGRLSYLRERKRAGAPYVCGGWGRRAFA